MPSRFQPKVKSIRYASPGQFNLEVILIAVAFTVGSAVKIVVKRGAEKNKQIL
jgi:hypothetical protein